MEKFGNEDQFLPTGILRRPSGPFRIGLTRGAGGSVVAGIVLVAWVDPTFMWGGVLIAAATLVAAGFLTASAAACRRAWAGMVCGAVLPALAVGVWLLFQPHDPLGWNVILGVILPVFALASALVLGSIGFGLRVLVWPVGRDHWQPLAVAVAVIALALAAVGSATGYFRWGGLFRTCPDGRACVYEVGISVVVPPGWHAKSPSGDILWEMAWDRNPEQVGVMVKRGSVVLDASPLPATLDELETAALAQTSGASLILLGNSTATATRMALPVGDATCLRYQRFMFLWDWQPDLTDCWFFVDGTIALVSAVDAPSADLDAFLQSIRALPEEGEARR